MALHTWYSGLEVNHQRIVYYFVNEMDAPGCQEFPNHTVASDVQDAPMSACGRCRTGTERPLWGAGADLLLTPPEAA
jgi:hypothetical protein